MHDPRYPRGLRISCRTVENQLGIAMLTNDRSMCLIDNCCAAQRGNVANPLVLIHGYGSSGDAFSIWKDAFLKAGRKIEEISIGNYVTLNNEITVDDIANGLQHALHLKGIDKAPFDALVHSTGMLVIRAWLTASNAQTSRQGLLKHLVAMAPATFGSPLAAKGRSLLGRIFQGNKHFGPDFLDSGNLVLSNLELASEYTWNLAH